MYQPLVPCPSCGRHIRVAEAACPFCSSAVPEGIETRVIPSANRRLTRAAAFVFGAAVAVTGCGSETSGGGSSNGSSSSTSGGSDGGPDDDGGAMAEYGAPVDAGPDDDGGGMAEYGAPIPDGGPDDDGGGAPKYGGPPADAG